MADESRADFRPAPRPWVYGPNGPAARALRDAAGRRRAAASEKTERRVASRLRDQWSAEALSSPDFFSALAFAADPPGYVALAAAGKDPGAAIADRAAAASAEAVRAACPYGLPDGLRGRALMAAVSRGVGELRGAPLAEAARAVSVVGSPSALAALAACVACGASVVLPGGDGPPCRVDARGASAVAWLHVDRAKTFMERP